MHSIVQLLVKLQDSTSDLAVYQIMYNYVSQDAGVD